MKRHFKGFVAKVEPLRSERASEDKNGLLPIILIGIAGEIPNKTVISGTVAQRMEIFEGGVYLFQANELDEDPEYGRQFQFMKISRELNPIETLQANDYVGKLKIVNIDQYDTTSNDPNVLELESTFK